MGNITAKIVKNDICEIDRELTVLINNNGNTDATLSKTVLKVKTSDGKTKTITCTADDFGTIYAGDIARIAIITEQDLPVGNAELKLIFSAEGCKDKIITKNFNIRKATDEERNS